MKTIRIAAILMLLPCLAFSQNLRCELLNQSLGISDLVPARDYNDLWGYKQFGRMVISPKYESAGHFNEGLAPVMLRGKYG